MAKFCKKCGNQLKDTSKFCSKCGTPYVDEPNTSITPQATVPPANPQVSSTSSNNESGNKGCLFKLIKWVVIIGIVLFAFSVLCGKDTTEEKVADNNNKTTTSSVTNKKEASSNSAGSNVRDPAHFGATDKVFLGKWKRDNPQAPKDPSWIAIKEANSQTGGYEVEIFFYRIADVKAYANIDGNKLSINQGTINGRFNFRGTIEKTSRGIRLTITESAFEYVKKGSVYEYKKN